ncbi:hypothetical protein DEO72_LG10g1825 [Vigna unguiculata]|uniref:Uncharacterized protein n=1 Tax=Vigna unguiculata TaxID=3917 RepID=A0A4D6NEI1_VIGUN|nr:hypothetical protein DEO72_LG10g1825 [Vigna unguiculata]
MRAKIRTHQSPIEASEVGEPYDGKLSPAVRRGLNYRVLLKRGPLNKCRAGKLARQAISYTRYQSEVVEPWHPPRLLAQGRLTINQRKRSKSAEIGDRRGRIEAQCDGWRGISLGA